MNKNINEIIEPTEKELESVRRHHHWFHRVWRKKDQVPHASVINMLEFR